MAVVERTDGAERLVEAPQLSVVMPLYNEEECIDPAVEEVLSVLDGLPLASELVLVNDGSTDSTGEKAAAWARADARVRVIEFRRNFGQTAAMSAGFEHARGRTIVVMDGDQQNDPADIPILLAALEEGYDVASGWRANRQDKLIMRRLPSKAANALISRVTGLHLHDYGCTLKAYDRAVIERLELFGELHRFIPALALVAGAKVTEIPVNHRARTRGSSKYGISRLPKVVLDLVTVKFLIAYRQKPMHFFGRLALGSGAAAAGTASWSVLRRTRRETSGTHGVAATLTLAALQFLSFGLLSEQLTRIYFKQSVERPYVVRDMADPGEVALVDGVDDTETSDTGMVPLREGMQVAG